MSAFVVDDRHIDFMLTAAEQLAQRSRGKFSWMAPGEAEESDFERGEVWGQTAVANAQTRRRTLDRDNVSNVGRMLLLTNHRSVAFRYDEQPEIPIYDFNRYMGEIEPVAVLKAIACFEYQSCERPDWQQSEAYAFCETLRHIAINHLDGYDDARWEVTA